MGLEYGHRNPRAATHIVMEQFASLQLTPEVATESMMQLANVFRGDFEKRQGWGWHDLESWKLFLTTIRSINQISKDIVAEDVIKNDYVAGANNFDVAKVEADAAAYQLPAEYTSVDVEKIRARL
jgi:NitT/TauT family transport system substrate-binding protein